jgi:hypothetical protein
MVTTQNKICFLGLLFLLIIGFIFGIDMALSTGALGVVMIGLKVELSEQIEALKDDDSCK